MAKGHWSISFSSLENAQNIAREWDKHEENPLNTSMMQLLIYFSCPWFFFGFKIEDLDVTSYFLKVTGNVAPPLSTMPIDSSYVFLPSSSNKFQNIYFWFFYLKDYFKQVKNNCLPLSNTNNSHKTTKRDVNLNTGWES